jgi:hypothetical protein
MTISFGDNVTILESDETNELGIAGEVGQVYGETTPSVTGVSVIGKTDEDYAINVSIEGRDEEFWLSPEILKLIDHGEGTELIIGNHRAVRNADGSWTESEIHTKKKWWQVWM